ncbi:MAG: hypothetical protein JNK16_07480 [Phycisphaerales bacterium]|nr:hypothetical protein [Phycisphaerales bacterium]
MPDAISMSLRVATSPIWLLWRGYLLLWWAFDDSSERAASKLSAKTTAAADIPPPRFVDGEDSGEVGNPIAGAKVAKASKKTGMPLPPPMPVPTGMLKGGFVGSMGLCSLFAMITGGLAASDAMSGPRATMLWAWGCTVVLCSSVLLVRSVARKRWERPRGPVGRMKDACVGVAKGACESVKARMASMGKGVGASFGKKEQPKPVEAPVAEAPVTPENIYGAAAFRSAVKSLVPAVARGARGVLHPLRDRASKGFAWAADKSRPGSKAA